MIHTLFAPPMIHTLGDQSPGLSAPTRVRSQPAPLNLLRTSPHAHLATSRPHLDRADPWEPTRPEPAAAVECAAESLQGGGLPGGGAADQPEAEHGAAVAAAPHV
eukprot:342112-Chlamydomonas_euryale.AAC.2